MFGVVALLLATMTPVFAHDSQEEEDMFANHVETVVIKEEDTEKLDEHGSDQFDNFSETDDDLKDSSVEEQESVEIVQDNKSSNHKDVAPKQVEVLNDEILIKDLEFLKSINYSLNKGYTDESQPTLEQLQSMTTLVIYDQETFNGYTYIESVEGLELLTSLEKIEIIRAFVPESLFEIVGTLPNLKTFEFTNSYTAGNSSTVSVKGYPVNGVSSDRVPFNATMNLGLLGNSQSIERIKVKNSYLEYLPNYEYRKRGNLVLSGLENLQSLKHLELSTFASVDDSTLQFVKGLQNLQSLNSIEVPFTNIDSLNALPETADVYMNWMEVLDYSQLNDTDMRNTSFGHDLFVTQVQPYVKNQELYTADYNTGMIIPENATNISVIVGSEVTLDAWELVNNELHLNISTDNLGSFTLYNPVTNAFDRPVSGFRYSVSYTLASGKKVEYPLLVAELGQYAAFKLVDNTNRSFDEQLIYVKINEDGTVTPPQDDAFNLEGYQITNWYVDEHLTTLANFDETIASGTIFYGAVEPLINTYTVTFESNGGTQIQKLLDVKEGSLINVPMMPQLDGHTFDGWFVDQLLQTQWDFDTDVVTSDMTLYAKWVENKQEEVTPPIKEDPDEDIKPPIEETPDEIVKPPVEDVDEPLTEDSDSTVVEPIVKEKQRTPQTGINDSKIMYASILFTAFVLIVVMRRKVKR